MLFRKDIEPMCLYCARGVRLGDQSVGCRRCGVVPADYHCRAFRYDPMKRIPPRPVAPDPEKHAREEFSL